MNEVQNVITALEKLGLTEYESRCFVALVRLPHGTAKEIGKVADIPRSRVYETMERLQKRGLAELQQTEPRTYQSVSVDTALRMLRAEYDSYLETIEQSLHELEPTYMKAIQGVWAINNHDQVTGRIVDLIGRATEEIVMIILDDDLLDNATIEALREVNDRTVSIYIGTTADSIRDQVRDAEINAELFSTDLIEWFTAMSGSPRIGRLAMVDRDPVLVSALHEETLPGVPNETAAWSDGIDHGFATFTERVFTYDLNENVEQLSESIDTE